MSNTHPDALQYLQNDVPTLGWFEPKSQTFFTGPERPSAQELEARGLRGVGYFDLVPLAPRMAVGATTRGKLLQAYAAANQSFREVVEAAARGTDSEVRALAQAVLDCVLDAGSSDAGNVAGVLALQDQVRKAERSLEFHLDRAEKRHCTLFDWAHASLPEPQKTEYFNIVANGQPSANVSQAPPHMVLLARETYRANTAEAEAQALREELALLRYECEQVARAQAVPTTSDKADGA